jgi:head-tail adaptor
VSRRVKLRRKLILEESTPLPDEAGGFDAAWTGLGILWAEVSARTGSETFISGKPRSQVVYRMIVRGAPAGAPSRPKAGHRLRDGARVFDIVSVAEADPAGQFLEIIAEEGRRC